ncbi:nicotine N-demethylase CYP82E4-like [Nicotiana tabacum]|uniref:Cytochrome P450 82C2-like n=2 Tax=Nicotiana TaxID=4085 RepID=A0A1S4D170_TOBAC|nr:PREDICTED: cytochrome P450 82C2-like [Nicotiana sylvestris]XP_016507136.1 PREDICTED: cytochrome P450 82C2-like [Nicotiana tabacum]
MEDNLFSHFYAISVLIVFAFFSIFIWKLKYFKLSKPLNPLPPEISGGWPVIGHLLQFSGADDIPLSRKLATLAEKYGPVFTFRLGLPRVLVVSSYDAVRDCLNANDKAFAARPASLAGEYIGYNNAMLFLSSYGPYWRKIRKIVLQEVLSSSRLEKLKNVRVSELQTSIKELFSLFPVTGDHSSVTGDHSSITGDNLPVTGDYVPVKLNLTNWIEKLTLSLIVKMIAGKSYGRLNEKAEDEEEAERFKKALKDFMYISMEFVLWDAFPIPLFKWIDFQGHVKFMKRTFKDIDCVLQNWLDEHVKKREGVDVVAGNEQDFIDVMLSMMSNEDFADSYTRETTIKATALSMVLDASDTTAIHLNWVMAILLNHRDVMKKVQEELDTKISRNRWVEESDIKNLVYFQAVIKETLRLYPPAPLLVPHESVEDCIVHGYHIPKGTRLWVNTMKLQRDPEIWSNPDTFDPERFLTSQAGFDVRGQQYEFIPFGSGRRSCPGITYATQVTHLAIAHLLQGFDFSTLLNEPLDMKEGLGMTMRKVNPIEVLIMPRLPSVLYKF